MRVVILLSGGIDSACAAASCMADGCDVSGLFVRYGQPHTGAEMESARKVADAMGIRLDRVDAGGMNPAALKTGERVVPFRNLMLIALGAAHAARVGADAVAIGCNADDAGVFFDCRAEFMHHTARALAVCHEGVELLTPLISTNKPGVVSYARSLGVPLHLTHSCYTPRRDEVGAWAPCGKCPACELRDAALRA